MKCLFMLTPDISICLITLLIPEFSRIIAVTLLGIAWLLGNVYLSFHERKDVSVQLLTDFQKI